MNINELYKDLGLKILYNGEDRRTRNGITRSIFGESIKYDMEKNGFPLLSTRKINYKAAFAEFEAFIKDAKTVEEFEELGCSYWALWADEKGSLKLDYPPRTQLDYVINLLKTDKYSRRILIDLWNPEHIGKLSLEPCHTQYQFYVNKTDKLHMIWNQRSVDYAIGAPYDFVLAGCYMLSLCKECNLWPGTITFNFGDIHLYEEHIEKFKDMMHRPTAATKVDAFSWEGPYDFNIDSISIHNYNPQKHISFELKE